MSNEPGTAEQLPEESVDGLTAKQVAQYLLQHPDFFVEQEELLTSLKLPHESGKAVSLLERQVTLLRNRSRDTRIKLNNLLDNARSNDQLFEITRELVLALLRARDAGEVIQVAEDKLHIQENVEICEIVVLAPENSKVQLPGRVAEQKLVTELFPEVFRLKRTYCGDLNKEQLDFLFGESEKPVSSIALCPILSEGNVLGLLVIGNSLKNYFHVNLDTLFLDFIGNVIGAVLSNYIPAD